MTGVIYPLAVTGVAQALFHDKANGSEVKADGKVVGSSLIGQTWNVEDGRPDPKWFQPRPSAGKYDPLASGASNLAATSPELRKHVEERKARSPRSTGSRVRGAAPTRSRPAAPAWTRTSPRRTRRSRSTGSPRPGIWTRRRCADWSRTASTRGPPASSGNPVNVLELNLALRRLHG